LIRATRTYDFIVRLELRQVLRLELLLEQRLVLLLCQQRLHYGGDDGGDGVLPRGDGGASCKRHFFRRKLSRTLLHRFHPSHSK
jgi:hypothetical protein